MAVLVLSELGNNASFLPSKEGVTQGDPISMIFFGFAYLPRCEDLRAYNRDVLQLWYVDDAAMFGTGVSVI